MTGCLLIAMPYAAAGQAGEGVVRGVVRDARNAQPVPSAQVVVEGTRQGVLTDSAGRFHLTGLTAASVQFRVTRIGYRPLTHVARTGDMEIELQLEPAPTQLDEIVVTGTPAGVQTRSIGNVVDKIKVDDIAKTAPVSNMGELLNARSPGVLLQNTTGMVGAGPRIKIRSAASLSLSSQPLLYIDGVRVDNSVGTGPGAMVSRLNDIDPANIESIEIIKGPSAATLYGTEASDGVIQIITKKGSSGTPTADITVRQGATWFMNAEDRFPTYYWRNPGTGQVEEGNLLKLEKERGTPVVTTGRLQEYALNVRGGGPAMNYFVGTSYADNEGIEPTNRDKRYNGRVNLGFSPIQSLDIAVNQGLVLGRTNLSAGSDGSSALTQGLWGGLVLLDTDTRGFLSRPPEAVWNATQRTLDVNRYTGSVTMNHRPWTWLTQRLTVGADLTDEKGTSLTPRMGPELARFYSAFAASGSIEVNRRTTLFTTVDYSGTVTKSIGSSLTSLSSLGGQFYRKGTRFETLTGQQFPAPGVTSVGGAATRIASDDFVENSTLGMFVQQQFAWNDRLFVTGALRGDDNSAFGESYRFVMYPKVSATWIVSDEPFWSLAAVDGLKLRAAYGTSGKQPDAFAAVRTFNPRTGPGGTPAVTPGSIGNPDLGPERSAELELGFDASFMKERMRLELTYYTRKTTDAILMRQTAPSFGFPGVQYVNAGATSAHGLELLASSRIISGPRFSWDVTANFSTNSNKILELGGLEFIPSREVSGYRPGYPLDAFFIKRVVSARLDDGGNATDILCDGGPGVAPAECGSAPRVYLGRSTPSYLGSFSSSLSFLDRFRLHVLVDFQGGHQKFNKEWYNRCPWGIEGNCPERTFPERYSPERIAEVELGDIGISGTSALESGRFAKLREVSLSYSLPNTVAGALRARRATLTLAGRNLHTWTRYTGFDPEALDPDAFQAMRWGDQGSLPQLAQFLTTLNLTF